jgi:hypothetical protein
MIDYRTLQTMYQQWCSGQSDAARRWLDFVEMAAKFAGVAQKDMAEALQKTLWFDWTREE